MSFFTSPEKQFLENLKAFIAYGKEKNISLLQMEGPEKFFQAEPVRNLIQFGAKNNDFLFPLVESFRHFASLEPYRASMTGYLIGLYGESNITNEDTDLALAEFYLEAVVLCLQFLDAVFEQLNIIPDDFFNSEDPFALLEQADMEKIYQHHPDAVQAWKGLDMLSLGVMSRISRSLPMREKLREEEMLAPWCRMLGNFHGTASYVPYILKMAEKETVLCISPKTGKGVEIALEQIDSNYVLFTLLQFALYHQNLLEPFGASPFQYNPIVEKLAKHEPVDSKEYPEHLYQEGCFSYYTYPAYGTDGHYDQMEVVWGEGNLYEIPKLDGRFIILLDKPAVHRSWGEAMVCSVHPGLSPKVEILRELSCEEVSQWMDKIIAANKKICQ